MANILLTPLYEQKQREFNVQGSGLRRFEEDFISSVNRAINRINRDADLATAITRITDTEGSVALDEKYEDVISAGVSLFLHYSGSRPSKGSELLVPTIERQFAEGISMIATNLLNDRMDADADDEVIGIDGMN